ncbi:conserved Plasmodium protein, unknown function [Plasmodium malariae]|uniref:Uncharacterized protein n=1 Tax=Plasmodium malariae TaxID=5858 RepID=A0A1C3KLB1_PLAMA|nr:conserved Plasmodium protein, unknown function [Plasmodium malariae]
MKSMYQVNNYEDHFMYPKNNVSRIIKTNDEKKEYRISLNNIRKMEESYRDAKKNGKYEYLDASHLEMLDLNKNIQNILPKPVKPTLNLESLCKQTSAILRHNKSMIGGMNIGEQQLQQQQQQQQQQNIKRFYELGLPQVIGTYIQPLNKKQDDSSKRGNLEKDSFSLASASPFFHPPNFSTKLIHAPNKFVPLNINNKSTNVYGLPSYLIPEDKPQNLTVTVVPNKDKYILEKEAKHLKTLLDNSSQGIVNSTPDYQKIISPSRLSNSKNKENNNDFGNNHNNINHNNEIESNFSFGKNETLENTREEYNYENNTENDVDSFVNEFHDSNNYRSSQKMNELIMNDSFGTHEHVSCHLKSSKQLDKARNNKLIQKRKNGINAFNELNKEECDRGEHISDEHDMVIRGTDEDSPNVHGTDEGKDHNKNVSSAKRTKLTKKKEYNPLLKKLEPLTCFKNPKTYINIRLGKPKKFYITNSSDPIDKKLRDWHNTHNSQIAWNKNRRGVYTFGKTEVALSLVHDKIIVKRINGKEVKDNLLTVEKFVSLNELFELQQEQNDILLKKMENRTVAF